MKAPPIFIVVHVGEFGRWTLHGYYFDEREAYEHARRLDAGCAPSMEHHVERLNPGGDDA